MVVGEYSIASAMRRIVTLSYPSASNSSRAASRIFFRTSSFSRSRRSVIPMAASVASVISAWFNVP